MKLSDIKGERSLEVMADVMELVEKLAGDEGFEGLVEALKEANGDTPSIVKAFCRFMPPLIRSYKEEIISVMASAADVPYEEYAENGEILKDLVELFSSDADALGFLASSDDAQA